MCSPWGYSNSDHPWRIAGHNGVEPKGSLLLLLVQSVGNPFYFPNTSSSQDFLPSLLSPKWERLDLLQLFCPLRCTSQKYRLNGCLQEQNLLFGRIILSEFPHFNPLSFRGLHGLLGIHSLQKLVCKKLKAFRCWCILRTPRALPLEAGFARHQRWWNLHSMLPIFFDLLRILRLAQTDYYILQLINLDQIVSTC